jgi:hypothetical protein
VGDETTDLLAKMTDEMRVMHDSGVILRFALDPVEAFMLLSSLQLALRHPGVFNTQTGNWLRKFAADLQDNLCNGKPALTEVVRRGWQEEYDVQPSR